jgi:outer membrane protein insertion porin family
VLAFHTQTAFINGYGGKEVPPYSRFYLGGENDLRGYDIRSISPVTFIPTQSAQTIFYSDPTAGGALRSISVPVLTYFATLPGADLQTFGNFEYRIPIAGPVEADLFFDAGTDGIVQKSGLHLDPTGLLNLQQQFPNSGVAGTLPIVPGTNFRVRGSTGIQFVVQLPIVHAPFRIYYAYNVNRLHQQIVAPQPFIEQSEVDFLRNSLNAVDPTIFKFQVLPQLNFIQNNPGRLNYFEPLTTFRFTVSRTF